MGQASGTLKEHHALPGPRWDSGLGCLVRAHASQAWAHVPPPHHSWVTSSRGSPHHTPQSEISRTAVAIGRAPIIRQAQAEPLHLGVHQVHPMHWITDTCTLTSPISQSGELKPTVGK